MYIRSLTLFLLSAVSAIPAHSFHPHFHTQKRTLTPDNTCGGSNAYVCNPSDPYGGRCCSAAGWCGNTDEYCATGCQSAFGTCAASGSASASPQPSAVPQPSPSSQPSAIPQPSSSSQPQSPTNAPSESGNSPTPNKEGCMWVVDGVGSFTHSQTFDFSALDSFPTNDLTISTYPIGSSPYTQLYTTSNVAVTSESLQLKVPGGQTASPILGAEISTQDDDILYGSVRTIFKASTVPGTCHGAFFYKDDKHEVDIEVITGDTWKGVHYTNQRANADAEASTVRMALPSDATTGFQEYRVDWLPGQTNFYLNGQLQKTLETNVPSIPGSWLWNNWSNGDPGWTGAPPLQDNVLEISKIEMYYNRTSSAGSC